MFGLSEEMIFGPMALSGRRIMYTCFAYFVSFTIGCKIPSITNEIITLSHSSLVSKSFGRLFFILDKASVDEIE